MSALTSRKPPDSFQLRVSAKRLAEAAFASGRRGTPRPLRLMTRRFIAAGRGMVTFPQASL